jgi:hypothetical protein
MLAFDTLKETVLDAIGERVGARLSACEFAKFQGPWELAETVAITEIPNTHVGSSKAAPVFRGHWLHLLKHAKKYAGFAVSTPIGPRETDWMVESVSIAGASASIAQTMVWVDEHFTEGLVRMVVDQKHQMHAFTIETTGQPLRAVVAHLPRRTAIRKRTIYEWPDLLDLLSKARAVSGLTSRRRRSRRKVEAA